MHLMDPCLISRLPMAESALHLRPRRPGPEARQFRFTARRRGGAERRDSAPGPPTETAAQRPQTHIRHQTSNIRRQTANIKHPAEGGTADSGFRRAPSVPSTSVHPWEWFCCNPQADCFSLKLNSLLVGGLSECRVGSILHISIGFVESVDYVSVNIGVNIV